NRRRHRGRSGVRSFSPPAGNARRCGRVGRTAKGGSGKADRTGRRAWPILTVCQALANGVMLRRVTKKYMYLGAGGGNNPALAASPPYKLGGPLMLILSRRLLLGAAAAVAALPARL